MSNSTSDVLSMLQRRERAKTQSAPSEVRRAAEEGGLRHMATAELQTGGRLHGVSSRSTSQSLTNLALAAKRLQRPAPVTDPERPTSVAAHHKDKTSRRKSKHGDDQERITPRSYIPMLKERQPKDVAEKAGRGPAGHAHHVRRSNDSSLPPIRVANVRYLFEIAPAGGTLAGAVMAASIPTTAARVTAKSRESGTAGVKTQTSPSLPSPATGTVSNVPGNTSLTGSVSLATEVSEVRHSSPGTGTPDKVKARAERRALRPVNNKQEGKQGRPNTPVPGKSLAGDGVTAAKRGIGGLRKLNRQARAARRVSTQSLPKLAAEKETFSIRHKIEQFRKWHEEQYRERLQLVKAEATQSQQTTAAHNGKSTTALPPSRNCKSLTSPLDVDYAKLLEENVKNSSDPFVAKKIICSKSERGGDSKSRSSRCKSGSTWHTWRDVNDSYAYTDVNKYIEENDLMPPDRINWIHGWLGEVEKAMNGLDPGGQGDGRVTVEDGDGFGSREDSFLNSERFAGLYQ